MAGDGGAGQISTESVALNESAWSQCAEYFIASSPAPLMSH